MLFFLMNWLFLRFLACDGLLAGVFGQTAQSSDPVSDIYGPTHKKSHLTRPAPTSMHLMSVSRIPNHSTPG